MDDARSCQVLVNVVVAELYLCLSSEGTDRRFSFMSGANRTSLTTWLLRVTSPIARTSALVSFPFTGCKGIGRLSTWSNDAQV